MNSGSPTANAEFRAYDHVATLSKWDREHLDESTLKPPVPIM
jgi:hypothetical protein